MGEHEVETKSSMLNSSTYDRIKWLALIGFPAVGALYYGLAQIWHLPHAEDVVGTITLIDIFLGALVGISKKSYDNSDAKYDGAINVTETAESKKFELEYHGDPHEIDEKKEVLFKVKPLGGE